jgi:FkbM family methyltransferase
MWLMGMARRVKRKARWLLYLKRFGGHWAKPLAENDVVLPPGSRVEGNRLMIPDLGIPIETPSPMTMELLKTVRHAVDLHKRAGAKLSIQSDHIEIEVDGVKGVALGTVDVNVFHEVFVEKLYLFEIPGSFVFVDIGMNIGSASLFFAKRYGAEVHSFELVPSTIELAKRNLQLNPELAERITIYPFGLADKDQEIELLVSPLQRAGNSLYGEMKAEQGRKETVSVRDIAPIMSKIESEANGRRIVLKVDAEGAEYEILTRLVSQNLLGLVDVILLEWHEREDKDPEELRQLLRDQGFRWFEREHEEAPVGLINAFRQ